MTLKELYESGVDVRESQIPNHWKKSFHEFIMGQTIYMDEITNECIYHGFDFRKWYYRNRISIEREENINKII